MERSLSFKIWFEMKWKLKQTSKSSDFGENTLFFKASFDALMRLPVRLTLQTNRKVGQIKKIASRTQLTGFEVQLKSRAIIMFCSQFYNMKHCSTFHFVLFP